MSHASASKVDSMIAAAQQGTAASIILDNKTLTEAQFDALIQALVKNESVTLLSLVETGISDKQLGALADALASHKAPITILNLEYNDLSDEGAKALASTLTSHPSLKQILLAGNQITDVGAEALHLAWRKNSHIVKVDLDMNQVASKLVKDMSKR